MRWKRTPNILVMWGEDRDSYPEGCLAPSTLTEREALALARSLTPLSAFRCLYMYGERYANKNQKDDK